MSRSRISLAWTIGLLAVVPVVVCAMIVGLLVFNDVMHELEVHEIIDLRDETHLNADEISSRLAMLREDVLTLSRHPKLRELIRRFEQLHAPDKELKQVLAEFREDKTARDLREKLQGAFTELCQLEFDTKKSLKPYLQVRVLGPDGRELVRVQRQEQDGGEFEMRAVALGDLDTQEHYLKHTSRYFTASRELAKKIGDAGPLPVHLTPIEPNKDKDAGQEGVPVIRAAVPLFFLPRAEDRTKPEFFGIAIINFDINRATSNLVSSARHLVYIAQGDAADAGAGEKLLFCPDRVDIADELADCKPDKHGGLILRDFKQQLQEHLVSGQRENIAKLLDQRDEPVNVTIGLDGWRLEERGLRIPDPNANGSNQEWFTLKPESRFCLVKLKLASLRDQQQADDLRAALKKKFEQCRADPKAYPGFRGPLFIPEGTEFTYFRAANKQTAHAILEDLERELGGQIHVVYDDTVCTNFVAYLYRIYFDPGRPSRYLLLMMGFSREELKGDLAGTKNYAILYSTLIIVVFVGVSWGVSRWLIVNPLRQITDASEKIAGGDFDVPLTLRRRRDEIGDLTRGFDHMIVRLRERDADVREREARLRAIFDTAAEGILTLDDSGRIETINLAGQRMFGLAPDELRGSHARRLLTKEDHAPLEAGLKALAENDSGEENIEATGLRTEKAISEARLDDSWIGSTSAEFPVEMSISLVPLEKSRLYTLIVRDVTERKRHERKMRLWNDQLRRAVDDRTAELRDALKDVERAVEARDAFLATVSHELRTPLNHIAGYCQLLELSELDDEQREDLRKLRESSDHLLAIINDILDYQKIILGKLTIEPKRFDLAALVRDVGESMESRAAERNNRLEVELAEGVGEVYTDERRLRQMLLNLVGNACKFTEDGTITIAARPEQGQGVDMMRIDVKDTGVGISQQAQEQLFQPFSKVGDRSLNPDGTGLGLVISRQLAQRLGGDLTVHSEPDQGSTFTIHLLAQWDESAARVAHPSQDAPSDLPPKSKPSDDGPEIAASAGPSPAASGEAAEPPPARGNKVLVIDDDPKVRELIGRFLEEADVEVVLAGSGAEGIELAKRHLPSVITLDVVMPGIDGWSVLASLKTDPETASIPVVLVTMLDEEQKGHMFGASDYLPKPVDGKRLVKVVRHYCRQDEATILLVEDNPKDREVVRRILASDGWDVVEAQNGLEGLEKFAASRPDLIVLDLMMPVMDGFEFIEELNRRFAGHQAPILVTTAKETDQAEWARLKGRVAHIIQKGQLDKEALLHEVHRRLWAESTSTSAP